MAATGALASLLLAAGCVGAANAQTEEGGTCHLLQAKAEKPFPSLVECYKYNVAACCMAGHDAEIETKWHALLPTNCLREFPGLEFFYCAGCSPGQPDFTTPCTAAAGDCKQVGPRATGTTAVALNKLSLFAGTCGSDDVCSGGTLKVCKAFADSVFDTDPTLYDKCGLNVPITKFVPDGDYGTDYPARSDRRWWHKTGEKDTVNSDSRFYNLTTDGTTSIILPSKVFSNAEEMLNVLKPPFFEEYFVEVVTGSEADCFSAAPRGALLSLAAAVLAVAVAVGLAE